MHSKHPGIELGNLEPVRSVSPLSMTYSRPGDKARESANVTLNPTSLHTHSPEIIFSKGHSNQTPAPHSRYRIVGRWKWELAALGLSLGVLIAMAAVLKEFNGPSVPDWGFAINLSTLLALLATIFRSAIVAIMAPDHFADQMGRLYDRNRTTATGAPPGF